MQTVNMCVVILTAVLVVASAGSAQVSNGLSVQVTAEQLVEAIRGFTAEAKSGLAVSEIAQEAVGLQDAAAAIIQQLSSEVSECETDLVIQKAASGIGSHSTLALLVAQDQIAALNGQMSLSLNVLELVSQQLEDELALNGDVGPQLTAVIFATDALAKIAAAAHAAADEILAIGNSAAWSSGARGLTWRYSRGTASVVVPSLAGGESVAVAKRQTTLTIEPSWTQKEGFKVAAKLTIKF